MIIVKDLHKIYGSLVSGTHALKGVSLRVKAGEFVAIMGRSGSGKSTLLHLLGLLDKPTRGEIYIDSKDAVALSDEQKASFRLRRLGYVFQEYSLVSEMSILENVCLPAVCLGRGGDHGKRARELLETVGLGHRLTHYPGEVSGGEQQRAAIARALVNEPAILFADEPTASLDVTSARVVLDLFRKLNQQLRQTIVMVTHEPEDAKFVDRVIRLEDGTVAEGA
jgi:putative ABC transport system ATP-binding protein